MRSFRRVLYVMQTNDMIQSRLSGAVRTRAREALSSSPDSRRAHEGLVCRRRRTPLRGVPGRYPGRPRAQAQTRLRVLRQGRAHVRHP